MDGSKDKLSSLFAAGLFLSFAASPKIKMGMPLPPNPIGVVAYTKKCHPKVSCIDRCDDGVVKEGQKGDDIRKHLGLIVAIPFLPQVSVEFFLDLDCPFSRKFFKVMYEKVIPAYEPQVSINSCGIGSMVKSM